MTGIYRILNVLTNQSYIGQSRDIMSRFEEHYYHRTAAQASPIDAAINYYGIQYFAFFILEVCDFADLDWKEDYYIKYFQSNIYGYNVITGGAHNIGTSNPKAKLTSEEVYYIRELYKSHYRADDVYDKMYKNRLSRTYFYNLWEGKSWPTVHMDVYTPENKSFHKSLAAPQLDKRYKHRPIDLSDEDIMVLRKRYVTETAEEIYNSIAVDCNFNTFKSLLNGGIKSRLPYYMKKKKIWIYPDK